MGILRNGFYTRGYKTTEQIYDMLGMRIGDTVFDTSRKERRIYDGNNWVSGNMISKTFITQSYTGSDSITYRDTAKCGQIVGYWTTGLSNATGIYTASLGGSNGGNVENAIGVMQFPINRSYGQSYVPSVVQYAGEAFIQTDVIPNGFQGSYIVPITTPAQGGVPGNYYYLFGRSGKDLVRNIGQVGVYTGGSPVLITVASGTTPSGYTGTMALALGVIRFGETN